MCGGLECILMFSKQFKARTQFCQIVTNNALLVNEITYNLRIANSLTNADIHNELTKTLAITDTRLTLADITTKQITTT